MRPPEIKEIAGRSAGNKSWSVWTTWSLRRMSLVAGVICCSARLTQHKTKTRNKKTKVMATKKNVKVRDLKPKKDAKGGGGGAREQHGKHHGPSLAQGHKGPKHEQ
jgi:hypothetical protein